MPRVSRANQARIQNATKARLELSKHHNKIVAVRRLPQQLKKLENIINFFRVGSKPFCSHLIIGSSRFWRLIQGHLSARDLHSKKADRSDYEIGEKWQRHVSDLKIIPGGKDAEAPFDIVEPDPLYYSPVCKMIVAQPDFRAKLLHEQGTSEEILIEVKSTNRYENYKAFKTRKATAQRYQLQIALQCSGIQRGYLIFCRGTAQTPEKSDNFEYRVIEVKKDINFFQTHKKKMLTGYTKLVADLVTFPNPPTPDFINMVRKELEKIEGDIFPGINQRSDGSESENVNLNQYFRQKCFISRFISKEQLAAHGITRSVGRPRKNGMELKRPRFTLKRNLSHFIRFPDEN
jgi:hypothetical protein